MDGELESMKESLVIKDKGDFIQLTIGNDLHKKSSNGRCIDELSVRLQTESVHKKTHEDDKISATVSSAACLSLSSGDDIVSIKQQKSSEFHFKNDPPIINEW